MNDGTEPLLVIDGKGNLQFGLVLRNETPFAGDNDPPGGLDEVKVIVQIERQVLMSALSCAVSRSDKRSKFRYCCAAGDPMYRRVHRSTTYRSVQSFTRSEHSRITRW